MNLQAKQDVWSRLRTALAARQAPEDFPVLVLAAHPDDETIGASLLLAHAPRSMVAFLTAGVPRDRSLWPASIHGSAEDYANIRRQEAIRALSWAQVSEPWIFWLAGVDQEVIFDVRRLAKGVRSLLCELRARALVTHPYEGGHPDHDAAALIARTACCRIDDPPALFEMTSYHARQGRSVTGEFLNSRPCDELSLELSREERERKRKMLAAYDSQQLVLASFTEDRERLRPAPDYDFEKPPHPGRLWYEQMGWPLTGERWRELAGRAELEEGACR
jgi:LmbE family N-acetylglucosaminyl deacetylase